MQPCLTTQRFLSTPSARRATLLVGIPPTVRVISIHALREEGDPGCRPRCRFSKISIHALREEGDQRLLFLKSLY